MSGVRLPPLAPRRAYEEESPRVVRTLPGASPRIAGPSVPSREAGQSVRIAAGSVPSREAGQSVRIAAGSVAQPSQGARGGVDGGWRPFVRVLVGAVVLQWTAGFLMVEMSAGGFPDEEAEYDAAAPIAWRQLRSVLVSIARGAVVMIPFSYTFVVGRKRLERMSLVIAAVFVLRGVFSDSLAGHSGSGDLSWIFHVVGTVVWIPVSFLPPWLVRGIQRRDLVPNDVASSFLHKFYPFGVVGIALSIMANAFVPVVFVVYMVVLLTTLIRILVIDRRTRLSVAYLAVISFLPGLVPGFVASLAIILVDNLDQTDALESFVTASALSTLIFFIMCFQYAFAIRGLPARYRTISLFPLQVFEDVWGEFFFANARVYSGGFFVLLGLQMARTLLRDTGVFDEAWRVTGNAWRWCCGQEPVRRADDAVVAWLRIWLQNMTSELTAMFVFVGTIAGEEARGDAFGTLTGLDHGDRIALLGGYGVVCVVEAAAHGVCYLVLRRAIVNTQAHVMATAMQTGEPSGQGERRRTMAELRVQSLSVSTEARKLVERHGVFLLASLLFVTLETLYLIRLLNLDYNAAY